MIGRVSAGKPSVLVVGNYPPDRQESMLRFARMLVDGLRSQGCAVEHVAPAPFFGRLHPGMGGVGKWLAYLDKYLVFPWQLRRRMRGMAAGSVVHVADHSNAMYARAARGSGRPVVVTCHDLGAVRGALGEDTDCPASATGKVLQRWIARSLGEADGIGCVSGATLRDVQRLIQRPDGRPPRAVVARLGLNAPFKPLDPAEARARLEKARERGFDPDAPFVLNVGSGLSRKNRLGVLRIFARVKDGWPEGRLVFAGEGLTPAELALVEELGLAGRVTPFIKPTDAELEALYNRATCLLFPSKFEGFGWPALEAQACGCPVLCSDAGSLPEVVESSAFVRPFANEEAFAGELLRLAYDDDARTRWRELGRRNAERFSTERMIEQYLKLYGEVGGRVGAALASTQAETRP